MHDTTRKLSMFALLGIVALLAIFPMSIASAQQPTKLPDTITVTGSGTSYAPPDIAYVSLGVEVLNADVTIAVNQANERVDAVMAALTNLGIAQADIRTENFYIYRENFYGDQGPTGDGTFHVNNALRVTVRDTEIVPEVLSAALNAGANNVNGVTFDVADTAGLKSDARAKAVDDARTVAAELAELLGVQVGDVVAVTEYMGSQPFPQAFYSGVGGGGGAGAPPIEGGSLAVSVSVEVTFALVR